MVSLAPILIGIVFFNVSELGAVDSSIYGWPPDNGDALFIGLFFNVCIELIGEDAHNSICEHAKPHGSEKEYYTGFEEKISNISPDNDPIEAGIIEFDIVSELLYE